MPIPQPHHQSPTGKSQDLHPRPGATLSWKNVSKVESVRVYVMSYTSRIKQFGIRVDKLTKSSKTIPCYQWSLKCTYYTLSNLRQVNHGFRFFLLGHAWWKSSAGLLDELDLVSEVPFKLWHLLSLLRWKLPCSILFECSTFGKTVF